MRNGVVRYGAMALFGAVFGACAGANQAPAGDGAARAVRPGAPGEPSRPLEPAAVTAPALPYTPADVQFMQRMILHHAQALTLTSLVPGRTEAREIALLARRIELSQEDELALMRNWLTDRSEPHPDTGSDPGQHAHPGAMPGMLSPGQLERLAAARGAEFDRLFLSAMIGHHEGALEMVAELFASPGAAQEDEIFRFASHVESDQRIEVARMNRMLAAYR